MKYFKSLLSASILIVFATSISFAQYPGMANVYRRIGQRNFEQQSQLWMLNLTMFNNSRFISETKSKYRIILKDSSTKEFTSFMFLDTIEHKNYLVFENKKFPKSDTVHRFEKIYPNNTLKIIANYRDDSYNKVEGEGLPNDSCWTFKVLFGPISIYAKTFDYLQTIDQWGAQEIIPSRIVGIQLNDGPILKYNAENLTQFMANNQKSVQFLNKKKYLKAINRYNSDSLNETKK